MAFYNWHFMDSYLELLVPLQDEVLAIFDAQPASLLDDLPKPSNPEELEKWELENLTLKFDRRLDLANNRDFVFCPSCSALESIGMRRDARFMQQTSNCRYACSALKDRERDSEGRYKWGKKGNLFLVGCSCAQRMHDENH
ncbi:hypothetical protein B484DRAFT_400217 [Ochromonadaceae sp. CCMP2298]|nr:hypothetical protein B484DRAFT_400217 [Ochromonadaceae sp. CCMP2298]